MAVIAASIRRKSKAPARPGEIDISRGRLYSPARPWTFAEATPLTRRTHNRPTAEWQRLDTAHHLHPFTDYKALAKKGSPNPLYQRWIDNYGSDDYEENVVSILDMTDEVAEGESAATRRAMIRLYSTTSRFEWMFWDMGYHQQPWPV